MKDKQRNAHSHFSFVCVVLAVTLLTSTTSVSVGAIYVSPAGQDANPGTAEQPLATLSKAQGRVRRLKTTATSPIMVWLESGTYYLGESLVFGPEDSGMKETPIIYHAREEGTVTISGGTRLRCDWKPYKNGIIVCDVPEAKTGELKFAELFVNGRRQIRARYPNGESRQP